MPADSPPRQCPGWPWPARRALRDSSARYRPPRRAPRSRRRSSPARSWSSTAAGRGLPRTGGKGRPGPAAARQPPSPRSPYSPSSRSHRRRGQRQHRRDRMIPALPRPPIRHPGEQSEQVSAPIRERVGKKRRCGRGNGSGNGRLAHDEAPVAGICERTPVPTGASSHPPAQHAGHDQIATSRYETRPNPSNDLGTPVAPFPKSTRESTRHSDRSSLPDWHWRRCRAASSAPRLGRLT